MDGTMCEGTGCPMASSCYRYNAEPNPFRQSYFMEVPLKWAGLTQEGSHNPIIAECAEYWEYPRVADSKGTNPKKEKK